MTFADQAKTSCEKELGNLANFKAGRKKLINSANVLMPLFSSTL